MVESPPTIEGRPTLLLLLQGRFSAYNSAATSVVLLPPASLQLPRTIRVRSAYVSAAQLLLVSRPLNTPFLWLVVDEFHQVSLAILIGLELVQIPLPTFFIAASSVASL